MKKFTFFLSAFTASFLFFSPAWGQNITQVGTATTATSGGGTITINKPSGIASGDIMIASITQSETGTGDNLSDAAATFGDWTLVTGSKIGTGQNPEFRATIMYRIATADDVAAAATSYQFTLDAQAEGVVGSIIAFRGVAVTGGVTGGPFDVVPGQINGLANDNSLNAASINLTTGKSAVIMFGFIGNDPGINTNWNIATTPGTLTELFDVVSTEDADIEIGAAWGIANSPGATGTGSASLASIAENGSILIALRPIPATAVLTTSGVLNVGVGIPVNLTAAVTNFAGTGNYNFTWNAAGASGLGINPVTQPGANNTKTIAYAAPGIYTVSASISRAGATAMSTNSLTIKVVSVPSVPNLWASSSNGSQIAAFTVNDGVNLSGDPANLFETTFPGTITGGTFTSAIGRNNKPSQASGYFYWLANTPTNSGIVEVFGSNSTGTNTTRIGTLDLNYEAGTNHLGFVRLGMGPDGTGWILAGDNSTFILAKFRPDGLLQNSLLPAADRLTIVDPDVTLNGATATSFINGDICVGGDGSLLTLANDGFGVTQIFVGVPNGTSTTLTKKFDVLKQDSSPFNGNVNGVAFDALGSLYVSAFTGLFYIDKNTINGPAGTIAISQVWVGTGLTDL
ncbi:MAG TPA: hypothetical protein VGO58_16140, partial [Chitinophagaceae bacterium]|nr:hypothetical protein [Chitinophagaceae bacterium]